MIKYVRVDPKESAYLRGRVVVVTLSYVVEGWWR